MAKPLINEKPYERFSPRRYGLAPSVTVTLHLLASGRTISDKKALLDTGAEMTEIYPRDVEIDTTRDVEYDPLRGTILVAIEVAGQVYSVQCAYRDHPFAGTEEMIIGMDLLSNWLVTLHGRRRLLSVSHLDPDD